MELAEVRRLLDRNRLVTLTGGGGSGKTRLAVEVGRRTAEAFPDGTAWVDLAPLSDAALVARHVSAALGLGESLDRSPIDTILEQLGPRTTLIVLDNCEHVVAECATVAHALLSGAPSLRILATSREALGVDGEVAWVVPPLSLPASADPITCEGMDHSEAVQLFVTRAQAVQPGFVLTDANAGPVAEVCRQLAGIPLAIELAAARLNVLRVEQIARRLDDVFGLLHTRSRTAPARHRTLRDAIDWSHDLLDAEEQRLFRRLSVFVGGFTLDAAEVVCAGDGIAQNQVLDLLSALVDKSLVRAETLQDDARCSLLEPCRQYAAEKLAKAGERDALRARHAEYFLALAEQLEPATRGGTRATEEMKRLERDHGNLRAVAEWSAEDASRAETQLRLEAALLWFYFAQGLYRESRERLEQGLARAEGVPPDVVGRAQTALGYQAFWQGDFPSVPGPMMAGLQLLRGAHDPEALSFALTGLGAAAGLGGDAKAALAMFDEAQAVLGGRAASDARGFPFMLLYAFASYWRGVVSQVVLQDLPAARAAFQVSVDVARSMANHQSIAHPLSALARVHTLMGDFEAARRCLAEALPIHARHDDRWGLGDALEGAAMLAAAEGAFERAAKLLGAADDVRASTGISLPPHLAMGRAAIVQAIQAQTGEAAFEAAHAAGRGLTVADLMSAAFGSIASPTRPPKMDESQFATSQAPIPTAAATTPHVHATAADDVDADLRVLGLGPLEVYRKGEPLEPGDWGSAKPRELLLFLLTHPAGATREQVGLALWPDSSAERVGNAFHVTLHRLRKALGDAAWITKVNDRYVVSPDIRCVFDAAVFESEVGAALKDLRSKRDGIDRLRAALAWYRGAFLEDEVVGDWHLEMRDRLARAHLDGGLALGQALFDAKRYAEAAEAYRRVIAEDDLHEGAYRQLMLSLAKSGDRSQALRLYQKLETLLEQELEAEPEPETVEIYEELKAAE